MLLDWLLAQLQFDQPGLWLLISLLAGGLGYAVLVLRPALRERLPWLTALRALGIPYVGLLVGGLSPRRMGLSEIDWLASVGWGVGLILALLGFLLLLRPTLTGLGGAGREERAPFPVVQAGLREFHWAFLRGSLWGIFAALGALPIANGLNGINGINGLIDSMATQPAYWAVWTAAAIALVEILLAANLASTDFEADRPALIVGFFTLLATSVLFLYTRNFWLCWLLHAGIVLAIAGQRPRSTAE